MDTGFQEDLLDMKALHVNDDFATFGPRFLALLFDSLILSVAPLLISFNNTAWQNTMLLIVLSCIDITYKSFFEYVYGATPGKMALHIKVVNYEYGKASLNQILLRNLHQIAEGITMFAIGIYNFNQLPFLYEYSFFTKAIIAANWFLLSLVAFSLVDMIVFFTSKDGRSLHDRMGKTYVIKAA